MTIENYSLRYTQGLYDGWFPSRDRYNIPHMEFPGSLGYLVYLMGFTGGAFEREKKIQSGEWIKVGGVWGPIPYGNAEDWIGQEEIVSARK